MTDDPPLTDAHADATAQSVPSSNAMPMTWEHSAQAPLAVDVVAAEGTPLSFLSISAGASAYGYVRGGPASLCGDAVILEAAVVTGAAGHPLSLL